ncbi:MAG: HD domain-containing protein [Acidobacteriota bacterium]
MSGDRLTVRDPVHGFIRADELEAALVATRPMQRLRSIRQLGLTNLIFPGAEHSRFSHALGAMHLAGRTYDALAPRSGGALPTADDCWERRAVRAAALLHDVGHAPFSHTAEDRFEDGIDHEEMTRRLLALPEIEGAFDEHGAGLEPQQVRDLLEGKVSGTLRLLYQVISGELDVDKMDYLLRDSLFCGVEYGKFDLERLLETAVPIEDPKTGLWGVGVHAGGVHALEAMVLARYYMFTQVYFNTTGKVLELHLGEWLREEEVFWSSEPEAFLELDDTTILSRMRKSQTLHARAVLAREHFVVARETKEHLSAEEKSAFEERLASLPDALRSQLLVSNSAKDPHRLSRSGVLVANRGVTVPMKEASHFIKHLTKIDQYRVYCPSALRREVAEALGK